MNPSTAPTVTRFPKLQALLGYLDGLDGRADLATLRRLLGELDASAAELTPACRFNNEAYQRNLIRETRFYELVCLCWRSGQRTPIHDHAGSSCAFRVIAGVATETRFLRSPSGLVYPGSTAHRQPGYICASREDDIHQVANTQTAGRDLVTLHIYSPPLRNFNVYSLDTRSAQAPGTVRPCPKVAVSKLD